MPRPEILFRGAQIVQRNSDSSESSSEVNRTRFLKLINRSRFLMVTVTRFLKLIDRTRFLKLIDRTRFLKLIDRTRFLNLINRTSFLKMLLDVSSRKSRAGEMVLIMPLLSSKEKNV